MFLVKKLFTKVHTFILHDQCDQIWRFVTILVIFRYYMTDLSHGTQDSHYMTDLAHGTQASIYLKSLKEQEVMYYITITRINVIEK